jgi:hypothetical protein
VVDGLDRLDDKIREELGIPISELVHGDTDSERVFALITAYVRQGRAIPARRSPTRSPGSALTCRSTPST